MKLTRNRVRSKQPSSTTERRAELNKMDVNVSNNGVMVAKVEGISPVIGGLLVQVVSLSLSP